MKIALIGYGKMGKAIETIALQRGHIITLKISSTNLHEFNTANLTNCDVAVEFTNPHNAYTNVTKCLEANLPTVCGSTGWANQIAAANTICLANNTALLVASNFSIGVNVFFELNKKLAQLMNHKNEYQIAIEEIHHTQKKDAPSGTAITLAEQIIQENNLKTNWTINAEPNANEIGITSIRQDPAPGTHTINYQSTTDTISITHTAHNRTGFALGAVLAAEYVHNKKGIFTMKDVLGL